MERSRLSVVDQARSLFERGRTSHPQLEVDEDTFAAYLRRVAIQPPESMSGSTAPDGRFVEDLYLACACAESISGAAEAFQLRYRRTIKTALAVLSRSATFRQDVEQQVYESLLVGQPERPPRIGAYAGHGPLGRWVAVVAQRTALMTLRSEASQARARDAVALERVEKSLDGETSFLKAEYRPLVNEALKQALSELPSRDRVVLHLQVVGGAGVKRIGTMYGVSPSTVSRWLAGTRRQVLRRTRELLSAQLGVSVDDIDSLMALVASQLDLSVNEVLAP